MINLQNNSMSGSLRRSVTDKWLINPALRPLKLRKSNDNLYAKKSTRFALGKVDFRLNEIVSNNLTNGELSILKRKAAMFLISYRHAARVGMARQNQLACYNAASLYLRQALNAYGGHNA